MRFCRPLGVVTNRLFQRFFSHPKNCPSLYIYVTNGPKWRQVFENFSMSSTCPTAAQIGQLDATGLCLPSA